VRKFRKNFNECFKLISIKINYMDFIIKLISKKNFTFFGKLILHFSLKISGYKNYGNFYKTGEEQVIELIKRNNIKNCLDFGVHVGEFSKQLKGYDIYQIMPYNNGIIKINPTRPENNIFHLSNFLFIKRKK